MNLHQIPELQAIDARGGLVRIPPEQDIPLTPRVRALLDAPAFRRLTHISQLGLVSLVYPAANHSRLEHSLGVYRMALLYLRRLCHDERFARDVAPSDAETLIAAALLHDIGHWPFCHPIEDMRIPGVVHHEHCAEQFILEGEIAQILREQWRLQPSAVMALLNGRPELAGARIVQSLLSGPIDIDKMDYLCRDSLHAGVPYGRNFDQQRLVGSLCLNETGDSLAITEKGRTAAEMMVFARYVMFSEVYWHHAVRSATAMLQRAFYLLYEQLDQTALFRMTEPAMIDALLTTAQSQPGQEGAHELLQGLFGGRRRLYKRLAQYSFFEDREMYQQLARRPFPWLADCAGRFVSLVNQRLTPRARKVADKANNPIQPHQVIFDAPPVDLEVQFHVEVFFPKANRYLLLEETSPVVGALARQQFDDYVKRVRIFVHPACVDQLKSLGDLRDLLYQAIRDGG